MKTLRMSILSLSVLVLFLIPSESMAKERNPHVRVNVKNAVHTGHHAQRHLKQNRYFRHLSQRDRLMATRLAGYMGTSTYKILVLRDRGYRWSEIGRRLDLSRRAIQAARHASTWNRFLRPVQRCGTHSYR